MKLGFLVSRKKYEAHPTSLVAVFVLGKEGHWSTLPLRKGNKSFQLDIDHKELLSLRQFCFALF